MPSVPVVVGGLTSKVRGPLVDAGIHLWVPESSYKGVVQKRPDIWLWGILGSVWGLRGHKEAEWGTSFESCVLLQALSIMLCRIFI